MGKPWAVRLVGFRSNELSKNCQKGHDTAYNYKTDKTEKYIPEDHRMFVL